IQWSRFYAIVAERFTAHFDVLLRVQHFGAPCGAGPAMIYGCPVAGLPVISFVGGNEDHPVGAAAAINSCCIRIFQYFDAGNISRVNGTEQADTVPGPRGIGEVADTLVVTGNRHAIYNIERVRTLQNGILPA